MRPTDRAVILRRLLLSSTALVATALVTPLAQAQSVVISDARTTEQNLDALTMGGLNFAVVTATGSVIVPTPNSTAISAAQSWQLNNAGTISGDRFGVHFSGGGGITNNGRINTQAVGVGQTAIRIEAGPTGIGTVINNGTIVGGTLRAIEISGGSAGGLGVTNNATGLISASGGAILMTGTNMLVSNSGTITSTSNVIRLNGDATVTNNATGRIIGTGTGSAIFLNNTGRVTNSGTISNISSSDAVSFQNGGVFINNATGVVTSSGAFNTVAFIHKASTVDNAGSISALSLDGAGVAISGGTVTNRATGKIFGAYNGVWINNSDTITPGVVAAGVLINDGTITSTNHDGVEIDPTDSSVVNTGTITTAGNQAGIWMQKAGTVTNSGTIGSLGGGLSINFGGTNFANTLILQTGSTLLGNVQAGGGAAVDQLIFQGTGTESLNKFLAFETLDMQGTDWTLNGAGTVSTSSQISAGTLRINGNLTTPILTVQSNSTLTGGGTVTGNVLASAGRVAPGSATTLRIGGNLNMASPSTFQVDLTPTTTSLVRATGTATLAGGQIGISFTPGSYVTGTVYNVLHADAGVTGTFANNMISMGSYRFNVTYDFDDVFVTLLRLAFDDPTVCASRNQCAVGGSLERLGPAIPGDLGDVVETLGMLDIPGQRRGLASLAGDQHPTLALLALDGHALFGQSVTRRLAERRNNSQQSAGGDGSYNVAMLGKPDGLVAANMPGGAPDALYGAWFRGYGAAGTLSGDGNAVGATYFVGGAAMGIDKQVMPGFIAGLSVGYARTGADFNGSNTSGRINSYDIGLYGSYQSGGFYFDAIASYAFLNNKTDRQIVVGDIVRQTNAKYNGQRYGLALETGYDINLGGFTIRPSIGGQYVHLRQNAFHEDGAGGLDLDGKKSSADSLRGNAGLKIGAQFGMAGIVMAPELRGKFEHEFMDNRISTDVNFTGQPAAGAFTVVGAKVPRNSMIVGGGLAALITPWTSAFVDYDYKFNKDQKIHNMTAGVRFAF